MLEQPMDDALAAYGAGHADGVKGLRDELRASDPDYRTGLFDGQVAAFETELLAAIRKALGDR